MSRGAGPRSPSYALRKYVILFTKGVVRVIEVLPPSYQDLFVRARAHLRDDDRVRAMWLGGSLARGTADEASDLDLILAVSDAVFDDFTSSWKEWLGSITPTVLAAELPFVKGIIYSVTPGFERLDVVVEPVSKLPETPHRYRSLVFDKDQLADRVPEPSPGPGPSKSTVEALITEYFRTNAVETILVRDDWLLAREHIHAVTSLIFRLLTEANAPLPPMGVKQWSTKLTPAQATALAGLPTDCHDLETLRDAHLRLATVFINNAVDLADQLGCSWPHELEAAAAAHLQRHLHLDEPFPRTASAVVIT